MKRKRPAVDNILIVGRLPSFAYLYDCEAEIWIAETIIVVQNSNSPHTHRTTISAMHRRIFGQLIPFALEMDAEQFRRKASSISLESFSIEEMRVARGILSSESTDMDNKNWNTILNYWIYNQ